MHLRSQANWSDTWGAFQYSKFGSIQNPKRVKDSQKQARESDPEGFARNQELSQEKKAAREEVRQLEKQRKNLYNQQSEIE